MDLSISQSAYYSQCYDILAACNDIDVAIHQCHKDIVVAAWTPDAQFRATMTKLRESYAPRNETDTTTLQCTIQELSDQIEQDLY